MNEPQPLYLYLMTILIFLFALSTVYLTMNAEIEEQGDECTKARYSYQCGQPKSIIM